MSLNGKLQKWVDAGLISSDQQTRILAHEADHSGDRWKHGIVFAGLFSILLGVALIVAANWQDISWQLKLAAHFAVNGVLIWLVWQWRNDALKNKHREVALFILWGLTLTLIALIGQVFQLGGHALDAVRVWFWITTPMVLLFTNNAFTARLWSLVFVCYVPFDILKQIEDLTQNDNLRLAIAFETAIGIPLLMWLAGSWPRFVAARPVMAGALREVAVFMATVCTSALSIIYYAPSFDPFSPLIPIFYALAVIVIRFLLQSLPRWTGEERDTIDLLCLCGLFICLPFVVMVESGLMAMVHFIALWLLAGTIWQNAQHNRLVSLAVTIITLRLFAGFIELFGSMMMSGLGFIVGGIVLIGLVIGARKLDKRLKEGSA